jgi:hypothetical protein
LVKADGNRLITPEEIAELPLSKDFPRETIIRCEP